MVVSGDEFFVGLAFENQDFVGLNVGLRDLAFAVELTDFGSFLIGIVFAGLVVGEIAIGGAADDFIRVLSIQRACGCLRGGEKSGTAYPILVSLSVCKPSLGCGLAVMRNRLLKNPKRYWPLMNADER